MHTPAAGKPRITDKAVRRSQINGPIEANNSVQPHPNYCVQQLYAIWFILASPINALSIFVPIGIFCGLKELGPLPTFAANFLAIVPLAAILGGATEALASHTGQMVGGLLNATFGNAVEMIVTINAIRRGLIGIVQGSLIGSVLSNLLLVLGMAFMANGLNMHDAAFNVTGAAANITCLVIGALAMCLPNVFMHIPDADVDDMISLSRIIAWIMLIVYGLFLVFQLKTHTDAFVGECGGEEAEEEPELHAALAAGLLMAATICVGVCSEYLVDAIEGVSEQFGVPSMFIGLILLPIVGNAAEHATAVSVAAKGKMDLALGVAVGSSTQITLFVIPFAVVVGWAFDVPMSLDFHIFESTTFLLSVFIASTVLSDGSANWFEGAMLCATYIIVAAVCWFLPDDMATQ